MPPIIDASTPHYTTPPRKKPAKLRSFTFRNAPPHTHGSNNMGTACLLVATRYPSFCLHHVSPAAMLVPVSASSLLPPQACLNSNMILHICKQFWPPSAPPPTLNTSVFAHLCSCSLLKTAATCSCSSMAPFLYGILHTPPSPGKDSCGFRVVTLWQVVEDRHGGRTGPPSHLLPEHGRHVASPSRLHPPFPSPPFLPPSHLLTCLAHCSPALTAFTLPPACFYRLLLPACLLPPLPQHAPHSYLPCLRTPGGTVPRSTWQPLWTLSQAGLSCYLRHDRRGSKQQLTRYAGCRCCTAKHQSHALLAAWRGRRHLTPAAAAGTCTSACHPPCPPSSVTCLSPCCRSLSCSHNRLWEAGSRAGRPGGRGG